MRTIAYSFIVILLSILSIPSYGQSPFDPDNYTLNFDDSIGLQHLKIDSTSNPLNCWQVGSPHKTVFTSAYSFPNAIVTDTVNPYLPNDTSVFIIENIASGGGFEGVHTAVISGYYNSDTDSLKDYATIEFSPDKGSTWIDLLNDSVLIDTLNHEYWYYQFNDKPILTGNSGGWKYFWINIARLGHFYGITDGDTILYRITFISDSIQSNKDGLMFDDLTFVDYYEGVNEQGYAPFESNCFPNPAQDHVTISYAINARTAFELKVFDISGQVVKERNTSSNQVLLPVQNLQNGLYFYKLVDRKNRRISTGKFVKE